MPNIWQDSHGQLRSEPVIQSNKCFVCKSKGLKIKTTAGSKLKKGKTINFLTHGTLSFSHSYLRNSLLTHSSNFSSFKLLKNSIFFFLLNMAFVKKMISCFFLILIATVATAFDYYDIDYYNQNVESSTTLMPKLTSPSLTTTGTKTKTVTPGQSSKITTKTPRKTTTTTTTTIAPTTTIKANNTSADFYPDRLNGLSTTSKNLAFSSSPNPTSLDKAHSIPIFIIHG